MKWKPNSLRVRWSIWTATAMIVTYILLSLVLATALSQWLLANERAAATISFTELESYMTTRGPALSFQDFERNTGLLNQFLSRNQSARLLNEDGVEILQINPSSPYPIFTGEVNSFQRMEEDGKVFLYKATEFQIGNGSLYIAMSHSLESYSSMITYLRWSLVLFGVLFVIVSGIAGYFLSSLLVRPLEELKYAMKQHALDNQVVPALSYTGTDEIGQLAEEYQQMVSRIHKVYAMQERFIGNVSHELRSPIQAMEGNLAMLQRWGKTDPQLVEETVTILQQETMRMRQMMEALLALAKQEEDSNHFADVKQVVEAAIERQDHHEAATITSSIEPAVLSISPVLLEQVITNLLTNAIRYSSEVPIISITGKVTDNKYILRIQDQGIGMDASELERIFEPFYTIDATRSKSAGGTGLGLTFVKQVLERAEGKISVTSVLGRGSEFTLHFPIKNK